MAYKHLNMLLIIWEQDRVDQMKRQTVETRNEIEKQNATMLNWQTVRQILISVKSVSFTTTTHLTS